VLLGATLTNEHVLLVCLHQAAGIVDGIGDIGALLRQHLVAAQHFLRDRQVLRKASSRCVSAWSLSHRIPLRCWIGRAYEHAGHGSLAPSATPWRLAPRSYSGDMWQSGPCLKCGRWPCSARCPERRLPAWVSRPGLMCPPHQGRRYGARTEEGSRTGRMQAHTCRPFAHFESSAAAPAPLRSPRSGQGPRRAATSKHPLGGVVWPRRREEAQGRGTRHRSVK